MSLKWRREQAAEAGDPVCRVVWSRVWSLRSHSGPKNATLASNQSAVRPVEQGARSRACRHPAAQALKWSSLNVPAGAARICRKGRCMHVLVIEDDTHTSAFLATGLAQEGVSTEVATEGRRGLTLALTGQFDAIITDLMLPGLDGFEIITRLGAAKVRTPILVLSARGAIDDRVVALRGGCDDYLTKPFAFAELVARLEALVRRASSSGTLIPTDAAASKSITCGEISLDVSRQRVTISGQELSLQPKELLLLGYLMRNETRVVSKSMILDHVWGMSFDPQTNVVEAKISRLRSKLAEHTATEWIHTVRGLGYTFERRDRT